METYEIGLAEMLKNEAEVFCLCGLPKLAASLRSLNVRVFCIPIVVSQRGRLMIYMFSNLIRLILAAVALIFLIPRYRIDIVHVNGFYESLLVLLARLFGCFVIRTSHSSSEVELHRWYREPTKYFPRLAAFYCLRFVSRVVCVSEAVSRDVLRSVPSAKVAAIPNWVQKMPDLTRDAGILGHLCVCFMWGAWSITRDCTSYLRQCAE